MGTRLRGKMAATQGGKLQNYLHTIDEQQNQMFLPMDA